MKLGDPLTAAAMSRSKDLIEWLGMSVVLAGDHVGSIWQVTGAFKQGASIVLVIECDGKQRIVFQRHVLRMTIQRAAKRFGRIDSRWEQIRRIVGAKTCEREKLLDRAKGTIQATQDERGRRWKGKKSVSKHKEK
jgi:hypothetical protein